MTTKKYRRLDLLLLLTIAVLGEFISHWAHIKFAGAGFHLSVSVLITFIAIIRWGTIGFIIYPLTGFVMFLFPVELNSIDVFILYPVANIFILFAAFIISKIEKKDINERPFMLIMTVLLCYFMIAIGKGCATLIISDSFKDGFISFLLIELFEMIMTILFVLFLKQRDGLFVDMYNYFEKQSGGQNE